MQPRHVIAQHDEAAAGDAGAGFEINAASQTLAYVHVVARREVEAARRAPAAHFKVGILVRTIGHAFLQQLGRCRASWSSSACAPLIAASAATSCSPSASPCAISGATSSPLALGHADLLRIGIAFGAQAIRLDLRGLAALFQRSESRHVQLEATTGQVRSHFGGCTAQQFRIDHFSSFLSLFFVVWSCAWRRCIASAMRISKPRWTGK